MSTNNNSANANNQSVIPSIGQSMSIFCSKLAYEVDKINKNRIDKASFDKTYIGMIQEVCFNADTPTNAQEYQRYKILYNGNEAYVYIRDGIIHSVGDRIMVTLPNGKIKDKYVEVLTPNAHPTKIEYDNDNDKIIETWKNNVGTEVKREYKLTVENKGTDDEQVSQITFPDGTVMDVTGFI